MNPQEWKGRQLLTVVVTDDDDNWDAGRKFLPKDFWWFKRRDFWEVRTISPVAQSNGQKKYRDA